MEQSDLDLLQLVPSYHLQAVMKMRRVEVAQSLLEPASILAATGDLNELEKSILGELVACGGRANSRDLALYLTSSGVLSLPRNDQQATTPYYPSAHPHGVYELALRDLLLRGLLFWGKSTHIANQDYANGVHDGVLIVPQAVKAATRVDIGHRSEGPLEEDVGETTRTLQRALYLYWTLVAGEQLALLSSGLLSRSALRQVMDGIGLRDEQVRAESDAPHLLFVRLLLMKLGLLQKKQGVLCATSAAKFFELSLLERARCCYRLWLETPFWNEILYLPEVSVRSGPAPLDAAHEEVVRARHTVVERIMHEQGEGWHDLSTFIARTKLYAPYLLFPRHPDKLRAERYMGESNVYGWDFRLRRGWLTPREGWHMVEGGFIRAVVAGPLYWLGVVELDREENPRSFRLSSVALAMMSDVAPDYQEAPSGRLIVQPNFELVALAPISESLLIKLDCFAERINLEHIAQYRLTKASVTRAIQVGLDTKSIQEVIERAAGADIPQNVQYSLVEWERQARRVEIWPGATLFEVDDASHLDALFADQETRPLFVSRLTPLLAHVAPHQLAALQEILWHRNYLPALTTAPTQDTISENGRFIVREPQWRLHEDGLLQPFYAVVDLYLQAEVERFSERDQQTDWPRMTAASVQKARVAGLSLDHMVRFLQQYCEGGIPASLLIRLKLWGGAYHEDSSGGAITVEHAPLLRIPEQVLQDLRADDEFASLLGSEVEEQSRLVRVKAQDLERVVALLLERGFLVE